MLILFCYFTFQVSIFKLTISSFENRINTNSAFCIHDKSSRFSFLVILHFICNFCYPAPPVSEPLVDESGDQRKNEEKSVNDGEIVAKEEGNEHNDKRSVFFCKEDFMKTQQNSIYLHIIHNPPPEKKKTTRVGVKYS